MWTFVLLFWLICIGGGYTYLLRYSFTAGLSIPAPERFSSPGVAQASSTRARLLIALHPRCPCSRATLHELAKIMSRATNACDVTALIFTPKGDSEDWLKGGLVNECRRLQCRIQADPGGEIAASLGCLTSGAVVLYDGAGKLRYQGGITGSRGHEGDNDGERTVLEILRGQHGSFSALPVFGCPIRSALSRGESLQ